MRSVEEQLLLFRQAMQGRELSVVKHGDVFKAVCNFLQSLKQGQVTAVDREALKLQTCTTFKLTEQQLFAQIYGGYNGNGDKSSGSTYKRAGYDSRALETELDSIIPKTGFLRHYVNYTLRSEAPLSYHFFSALIGIAAVCNRRVWLNMGYFKIFPALGVIILGPSGIKKTTSADIVVSMLQELHLSSIYSEKLTPEALIDAMKGENANGLIYAPEMAVFLNKQKYNEGLVQLITRFMDCPDVWESGTIMRGKHKLTNVAISVLMCSTPDWFVTNVPEDTFGGGFIARNILVVQEDSPRCEPIPRPGDPQIRQDLMNEMAALHSFNGEMVLSETAFAHHNRWYTEHKELSRDPEHEIMASYYQRKQSHLLRLAMCVHLSTCCYTDAPMVVCDNCFSTAAAILDWNEKFLPNLFKQLFKSQYGSDQELVLRSIRGVGGVITHSKLVHKLAYKFSASQVKSMVMSLKESEVVEEIRDGLNHLYRIKE
jgi:hypothetical protein